MRFTYDALGRLLTETGATGELARDWDSLSNLRRGESRYHYDRAGRLTRAGTLSPTLGYGQERFAWDGFRLRQALTEDAHGTQVRTWLYDPAGGGYTPIAAIDQGLGPDEGVGPALIYSVHTDPLGTPRELTDTDGRIAWSARYSAWGQRLGPVLLEADRHTPFATDCPLRYPGQYADDETGLHYNTFRYYDPEIGRFISPDPIGLVGGFNLYQYAPNATGWIDPLGWASGFVLDPNTLIHRIGGGGIDNSIR
ncbi:cell-wall associated Rhs family protein with YD-repeats [Methylocaldum marinum]|uniref:Cell-wall associated Rhs family protein with YD-repeats n=1 Tax=Methylocaldum marinum TaxID=1432792 RepID=A0A286P3T0_9GAMM|nr:RHS repeat-associated core domain-containing protein [Methylocaldum marinum]BBA32302.1 cell-wall associated Rhs family protein with YD-repeats [Methylocaldum marinum]